MKEQRKIYRIPANFRDSGYILNGMISKRNAIDAVILGLIAFFTVRLLPIQDDARLSAYILFIGLFGMIGVIGIKGIPVSDYLLDVLRWRKRRKHPYLYNTHGGAYSVTAADIMLQETSIGDYAADLLDKVKQGVSSKRMEYIEGETFQFARDPELTALSYAHEQRSATTPKADPADVQNPNATVQESNSTEINMEDIFDNLVLPNTEGRRG